MLIFLIRLLLPFAFIVLVNVIDIDILRHLGLLFDLMLSIFIFIDIIVLIVTVLQSEFKVNKELHIKLVGFVLLLF